MALVVTIILIIILSVVAINFAFGENGLISKAQQGKLLHDIEYTRERLGTVLTDAFAEKQINPNYNQDDFLDDFIYEREPEAEATEVEISLNGHTFELDRSVPQLGEYIGEAGNLPPTIRKVEVTNQTYSEVSVEVTTARADGAIYRYSYKKDGEADSSYQGNVEQASNTYTFTNLETLVIYNLRVELIKDGKVADTEVINVRLGELEEGSLTFGKETWSNGTASLPVSTTSTHQIQYQINGVNEGNWTIIANNGSIPNIKNGDTVFARLWDGSHGSEYISRLIEDTTPPEITRFEATEITASSIKVEVEAKDEESGLATTETYQYYLGSELKETSEEANYIFEELNPKSAYEIKVIVKNGVGQTSEKSITIQTTEPTVEEVLTTDKTTYVNYEDATGVTRLCAVLYDSSSPYGIEIITMDTVEDVELGNGTGSQQVNNTTYFNTAKNSYNNAISTLNSAASDYNNSTYSSRARCVGSNPSNPASDNPGYFTSSYSYMSSYNGQFKNGDTNYETDYNQMGTLGIRDIDKYYWLASRNVYSIMGYSYFHVRHVYTSNYLLGNSGLCYVDSNMAWRHGIE